MNFKRIEERFNLLWDFGWFDLTRFKVSGQDSDCGDGGRVLDEFLKSPISRRWFCTFPDPWGAPIDHHGPYWSEALSTDWYVPVTVEGLRSEVEGALADPEFTEPPTFEQRAPIDAWLAEVRTKHQEARVLRPPPPPVGRTDAHGIWVTFREFVCFDRESRELIVAVIGYD